MRFIFRRWCADGLSGQVSSFDYECLSRRRGDAFAAPIGRFGLGRDVNARVTMNVDPWPMPALLMRTVPS